MSQASQRPFVIHAHFYQPERNNPWTQTLEPEPSAAPDRDWNSRILRECYQPNGAARIFDARGRIERIVNNYERVSFDFGPTLLTWLERADPQTYRRVLDADRAAVARCGHGNALAQAYHHAILPLANERDRRTQIRWGLADFRRRFGRDAEGMWLPEAAVDQATVDALIDAGVGFTVLAPGQAARVRREPSAPWRDAAGRLDPSRPYRHRHSDGSGRSLALFFYHGGLAHDLAFNPEMADATTLLERVRAAAGDGLAHAALDGETFGHHRHFGELGLAYALFQAAGAHGLRPVNYASYLAEQPCEQEVEVIGGQGSSWSCAHGVGRWYRDCGCASGGAAGWSQSWRGPLRQALDVIRNGLAEVFESEGGSLLRSPWTARDDYVHVLTGGWSRTDFLDRHARGRLGQDQRTTLWTLLEAQRSAMVMYTSCGWFFADVSGIETVYVLRAGARVLSLMEELGAPGVPAVRGEALAALAEARSNNRAVGTGADVWREQVEPARVSPARAAAHTCMLRLVDASGPAGHGQPPGAGAYHIGTDDSRCDTHGHLRLRTARVAVTAAPTGRRQRFATAALHFGGVDFYAVVAPYPGDPAYESAVSTLWSAFPTAPTVQLLRLAHRLAGQEFGWEHVLPEGRQWITEMVLHDLRRRLQEQSSALYRDHRRTLEAVVATGQRLPDELRAVVTLSLAAQLERQLRGLLIAADDPGAGRGAPSDVDVDVDVERSTVLAVRSTLALARAHGSRLEPVHAARALSDSVTRAARAAAGSLHPAAADRLERLLTLCEELGLRVDLARAQEHAYEAATRARRGQLGPEQAAVAVGLGRALGLSPVAWSPPQR